VSFNLRDYVVVFENVISDELCDEVLSEYINDKNWTNAITKTGLRQDSRKCDNINMSDDFIINQNRDKRKSIDDKLYKIAGEIIRKYKEKFVNTNIDGDSGYILLRYQEGDFYKQHTDYFLQQPRSLSCSFALNDNYEGGEWGLFDREMVIKVPKGSALMFPSNFMYPHEIMPVTKGTRYSLATWFI